MEIWKPARFKNRTILYYEVSNLGRVRRTAGRDCAGRMRATKIIAPGLVSAGYLQANLSVDRVRVCASVHALVAFTFLGDPPSEYGRGLCAVNHKNGDKTDNRVENLEWATPSQNKNHASVNGLIARGESSARGKLKQSQVEKIRLERKSGRLLREMAKEHGVSESAISAICARKNWRHI